MGRHTGAMTPRLRTRLAWGYVAVLVLVWIALWRFSDDASVPTVIAFGPRWAWALPLLALLPRAPRGLALPLGLGAIVVLGPIMGFVGGGAWPGAADVPGLPLRIMSANLGSRQLVSGLLVSMIDRLRPDLVLMQECTERAEPAFAPDLWTFQEDDGLCVASRHPLDEIAVRYRRDEFGHGAFAARYRVRFNDRVIDVANVHLDSPRDGLTAIVQDAGGFGGLRAAIEQRRTQSRLVRAWLDQADQASLVVAGDFNLMPDGAIYRESWSHLLNAYSAGGLGWGYTKREGWITAARIDHILVGSRWQVTSAWVEAPSGSDHRPLVADLVLTH
jgi:endonuclease/exonuclease/phosphatase family metal-dependent hydrolase